VRVIGENGKVAFKNLNEDVDWTFEPNLHYHVLHGFLCIIEFFISEKS
jgi:hypothetical protein